MSLPGTSQDPFDSSRFGHTSSPNLSAGRIYQNALTSGNAQAHYGDRIIYGDSHIHHHREALHLRVWAGLTVAVPFHESGQPAPPRKPINTLRWLRDPQFVGREDILGNIKQVLEGYGCAALTGAGGVGLVLLQYPFCPRSDKLE